jgi:hypothetical protein
MFEIKQFYNYVQDSLHQQNQLRKDDSNWINERN